MPRRKLYCPDCSGWLEYNPAEESKDDVRARHVRWCNLEIHLPELHPDLVELNSFLEDLYPVPN